MLQNLYLKNYILIDELRLDFKSGFSVFTGETGAGKSILIDAIGLLMGDRFTADMIRHGSDKAIIEAVFSTNSKHIASLLSDLNYDFDLNELIISRELSQEGRSINRINNRSVPVSLLKEIGQYLVDIHSQNDTQYLLNNRYHLQLLDAYNIDRELIEDVKQLYHVYAKLKNELNEKEKHDLNPDDLDFLSFQSLEIENANLVVGEDEELETQQRLLMSFEKVSTRLTSAIDLLDENEGARVKIYEAVKALRHIDELESLQPITTAIDELYFILVEQIEELKEQFNGLSFDEDRLNQIQDRIFQINKLKKKYGRTIEQILEQHADINERIHAIEHREEVLEQLRRDCARAYKQFELKALELREIRKNNARALETAIIKEIRDLYLEKAQFSIVFSEVFANQYGLDFVEFLISMNPGESLKPLIKVASGGELSRLMLGMKVIFNDLQSIETVIFDEIDSGVSGRVATAIGQKMSSLARHAQVFSVTHLGQVAACSKTHYLVSKIQANTLTNTNIIELSEEGRIQELAMIASGSNTQNALSAAQELFRHNQNLVNIDA
ncbi:MAG TPA: DNA repair protein RecN [Erysipelotrichaceae bacterium]|nr:DNA repair protein RecN [Erysipelotrichaceae bacterium]